MRVLIGANYQLNAHEIAEYLLGINKSSFHTILGDNLKSHHTEEKCRPYLLTDEQKVNRVTASQEIMGYSDVDQKHVVTGHNSPNVTLRNFF
ncbi:hypothetical protein AVEN_242501-1 [Araneus ventricosus]|uniref:Uncharacterized protein n=1 Tax=Araneus ventricosus TaxID=182803 RepID=A0A4Y2PF57_ARAVE|nr:hypothetical protein AVEN_242501-1 [Araneus ventricosus]